MMTDYDNITICAQCNEGYADGFDHCPNGCQQSAISIPKSRQTVANTVLSVVSSLSKPDKPKSWTKTSIELNVPIVRHGATVWYVRHFKKSIKKGKDYNSFYYDGHWHSILELWFYRAWELTGYPMPTPEYRFHDARYWKLDFAWTDYKVCVELEGGAHSGGRHTRGQGFKNDIEKYNQLTAMGWQLYRFADTKAEHIDFMKARFDYMMTESEAA